MASLYLNALVAGVLTGCVYALIASGLTLLFGVVRVVNVAHGEMVVLGMYGGYFTLHVVGLPMPIAVAVVAFVMFAFGYCLQRWIVARVLSQPIHIQFLLYVGLALIITGVQATLFGSDGYGFSSDASLQSYHIGSLRLDAAKTNAAFASLLLLAVLIVFLRFTILGKSVRACADNAIGARVVGVQLDRVFALTSGIGIACAGAAGVLIAPLFSAQPYMGSGLTALAFIIVIFGGLGSLPGAFAGGIVVGVVEALAALVVEPALKTSFSFGLLILILLFRPYGILGKRGMS